MHLHAHVPGLPLAQIFFRSHNLEVAESVPKFLPKRLDVLLMMNLLQKEPTVKWSLTHQEKNMALFK